MAHLTLSQIAEIVGGQFTGDPAKEIRGAKPLEMAGPDDITWAEGVSFLKRLGDIRAGAVFVPLNYAGEAVSVIRVSHPKLAFARILGVFHPPLRKPIGIHPTAVIADTAVLGTDVSVGPHVVIGDRSVIGKGSQLHAGVVIGDAVTIGSDAVVHPNVTIGDGCLIGHRVRINAGTVIGGEGFGFVPDGDAYLKLPHIGNVSIGDDVEIGANACIDRGTFGSTRILRGVKMDNLVHVAHNVVVGEDTLLVAQVGVSGSVRIGRHAILAGQAGVAQHLEIGDRAVVGPQAGLGRSLSPGEVVSGSPGIAHALWLRVQRTIPLLPKLKRRIEELEKRLAALDPGSNATDSK